MKETEVPRIATCAQNLNAMLKGGLSKGSVSMLGGSLGAGKTILAQQICFHYASSGHRVLWFSTLSGRS